MNQMSSTGRWAVAVAALLLLGLLFYGLRTDRPQPQTTAGQATSTSPAPAPSVRPQTAPPTAAQTPPPASPQAKPGSQATQRADTSPNTLADTSTPNVTPAAPPAAAALPNFVDLVHTVKPAVVSIRVKADVGAQVTRDDSGSPFEGSPFGRFFRGQPDADQDRMPQRHFAQGQGSGFFVSPDGYVVTNNHVVANAVKVDIAMDDGTVLPAKVVGTDPKTDLALVKVEGDRRNFPYVTFADELPKIGEWVIAMGNPFGLGGTVTAGIVSAQGRDIGSGPYDDFLQIDAAVNRGNSGGPTFNMGGKVVGVNTAIYSPGQSGGWVGIAFDIPAATVKPVIEQLKERGYVDRGWIGVQVQPVTKAIAEGLGIRDAAGALISGTDPNGPAAKAGLKPGDVITSISGTAIKDSRDLARKIAGLAPNTNVKVEYLRDGKAQTASVALGQLRDQTAASRRPAQPGGSGQGEQTKLGLAVAPAARVMGIGEQGLAVLRVDPNGKAAEAGLTPGDVILKVGAREVQSPQDLVSALDEAAKQNKQHALVLIRRNDRELFIALPVGTG
jgi:serine protease Do